MLFFSNYLPLQIWTLKICFHDISKTITARSFKLDQLIKFSHGNMAYVMIMLFINIELFMIDNYLSKGFPGQLHEALWKCIGMILA